MNITQIKAAAETAKSRTNDKRWLAAIEKAVAGVESGWWIVTELHDGIMVTTETGQTYHANGSCQCKAFELGQACKHRALARLIEIANEEMATSRQEILASIKSAWSRKYPADNLSDNLMARFRVNQLSMLADDMLAGVLAAIA